MSQDIFLPTFYTHYYKLNAGTLTKHSFASSPQATGAIIDSYQAHRLINLWNQISPRHITHYLHDADREEAVVLSLIPARYLVY